MEDERQLPAAVIPKAFVRVAAVVVPSVSAAIVATFGRRGVEVALLWVAVSLALTITAALVAYMLAAGQFPPRLGRGEIQLPAQDVDAAATSLEYLKQVLAEVVTRLGELEVTVHTLEAREAPTRSSDDEAG